jgi:hypothetical protein
MAEAFTCPKCKRTSYNRMDVAQRYCGSCHVYIDQWLCFRMTVADDVVDEHWFDALEPDYVDAEKPDYVEGIAERHAGIRARAEAAGLDWRLEIYDPGDDRTVRLGSSSRGMRAPEVIDLDDHERFLRRIAGLLGYE